MPKPSQPDQLIAAADAHSLVRTSPKGEGQRFIGRCVRCGLGGLAANQIFERCVPRPVLTLLKQGGNDG